MEIQEFATDCIKKLLESASEDFQKAYAAGVPMDISYDVKENGDMSVTMKTKYPVAVIGNTVGVKTDKWLGSKNNPFPPEE